MTEINHSYTRKEIATWVESQTKYKFQDLKNGVFFCKMLGIKFPEEAAKLKYNMTPLSEYDATCNLTLMKKILNKHGLQLNLNINTVLTSKNNFELAKWFKNLIDGPVATILNNYTSAAVLISQKTDKYKFSSEIPRRQIQDSTDKKKKMESAEKASKDGSQSKKRLSMAKSQTFFFKDKKQLRNELKIPINRQKKVNKQQEIPLKRYYETQFLPKMQDEGQDKQIRDSLIERALEESIQSFKKILQKVKTAIIKTDIAQYSAYKESITKAIFTK